jgi:hypothetical protein
VLVLESLADLVRELLAARITVIPIGTWRGLQTALHNANQLRSRIVIDGPDKPFPPYRLESLKEHQSAAEKFSTILFDAAQKLGDVLGPISEKKGWRRRLRTNRGPQSDVE